jgi:hypothetical protein
MSGYPAARFATAGAAYPLAKAATAPEAIGRLMP